VSHKEFAMEVRYCRCDGCGAKYSRSLGKYANGKGEIIDLCEMCVKQIILKALKKDIFILRTHCVHCGGKGILRQTNKGYLPCPHCGT
jgi:hypothetical protein